MEQWYFGLDLGGTKCAVVLGNAKGEIVNRIAFATGAQTAPHDILQRVYEAIEALQQTHAGARAPLAIGVSCGGPLDARLGIIQSPPNLPLWDNIPVCRLLAERYGCPVFLQNDANACAIAEWRFGAGQGTQNMVFLTFGTGLGAGLILNGRLYEGTNGMAGEVGHMRLAPGGPVGYGKRGSFEGFCSGGGIRQLGVAAACENGMFGKPAEAWCEQAAQEDITAKSLCEAAQAGDAAARAVIECSAAYLGKGLAVLIDVLNPQCIVIGSIYARSQALFRTCMEAQIAQEALAQSARACRVVPAALGDSIGDIAAITVAIEGFANTKEGECNI